MIYLDNAATTKPKQAVIDAINECLIETWGNPSSLHRMGQNAKAIVDDARKAVADLIGAKPSEIIFTSGACEANSLAICGYLNAHKRELLITTSIEHKSIMNIVESYQDASIVVPVDSNGFVDLRRLENVLKQLSFFAHPIVSIQYANNEIGTIQDLEHISEIVHLYGGILHTDATQIIPDRKINVTGIDMMSFSGQKLGAPKGIGVLYVREGIELSPIIYGSQEKSRRGGTENVPYIAGLGEAVRHLEYPTGEVRDYFVQQVLAQIPDCYLVGVTGENRLKNNASICFKGVSSEMMVVMLDQKGICVSSGSACNAGIKVSHVLEAIGMGEDAKSVVRFTFGDNTKYEVDVVVEELVKICKKLRKNS
jgi:cysteine desulfurase